MAGVTDTRRFLFRHFTDYKVSKLTGISRGRVRALREGRLDWSGKDSRRINYGYAKVQYARLRSAGLNVADARDFCRDIPRRVRSVIGESVRTSKLIARAEAFRLRHSAREKAWGKGRPAPKAWTPERLERKRRAIIRGMQKSKKVFEDRDDWIEKYLTQLRR